jgi:5-methylcytosine-specific restriction endonuclease McrA
VKQYENNPHQFQRGETKLTKAMDKYIAGGKTSSEFDTLIKVAEKDIHNYVYGAFQNIGRGTISSEFLLFKNDEKNRKLILTDCTNSILEDRNQIKIINDESESRCIIVSEAWRAGVNPNVLEYDNNHKILYSKNRSYRENLRSAVDVLLPYQKGKCFYCKRPSLSEVGGSQDSAFPDVDHFYPFRIIVKAMDYNPNGIWNLVIACKECNRGRDGKWDEPPDKVFFESLLERNKFFVEEHAHSLKNSILFSLGAKNSEQVTTKMKTIFEFFGLLSGWKPKHIFSDEDD